MTDQPYIPRRLAPPETTGPRASAAAAAHRARTYVNGTLRKDWDDEARAFVEYAEDGSVVESRPYNDEENARADARTAQAQEAEVEATLRQQLHAEIQALREATGLDDTPGTSTLRGIIATSNPTINGSPAAYVKGIARRQRDSNRALIRALRLVLGELSATNEED